MAGMRMRFREWRRAEAAKLGPMTWAKRLEYLFTYYKSWLAGFLVLLLFAGYVGDAVIQSRKETVLQGFFTNDVHDLFPAGELERAYAAQLKLGRDQRVIFEDDLYIDLGGEATQYTAASNGKIIAYMAVGELDFVVTSREVFQHFSGEVPMRDLSSLLPQELYRQLSPYIVDAPNETGALVPAAIEMSQSRFLRDSGLEEGSFYLFVPYSAPHQEALCAFIRYCFQP